MTLTAVLLAGGLSCRMGSDKATLRLAGESLWARQLRLLRELEPEALWISARIRPAWCPPEIKLVLDEPPSRGPLSGLSAALSKLQSSHLLALAIDLPQMTTVHLRKIVALACPGRGIIPLNGARFEPLCAVYPVESAEAAGQALEAGNLSLQSLAQTLLRQNLTRTHRLAESEKYLYHNANTPADMS